MEDKVPKKNNSKSRELFYPIISLERSEKQDLERSEYIDHMCHYTPGNITSGKYLIKISRFDSGTPEVCIFFKDLV